MTNVTVTPHSSDEPLRLDKRFRVPFVVSAPCPHCGTICDADLSDKYLSYPRVGHPEEVNLYCLECDYKGSNDPEFVVHVVVEVSLRAATEEEVTKAIGI